MAVKILSAGGRGVREIIWMPTEDQAERKYSALYGTILCMIILQQKPYVYSINLSINIMKTFRSFLDNIYEQTTRRLENW